MTILQMPTTTKTFGNQSLVVLADIPAAPAAVTSAEATAGENISCYMVGDWWPTATTEKVAKQRKMCQTKTSQSLGTTTHEAPALVYTYNPQTVGTPGGEGNEAYEALAEGTTVALLQRIGKAGNTPVAATDAYRLVVVELGPQIPGASADDAGGEATITQEVAYATGYDEPVDGVVAA